MKKKKTFYYSYIRKVEIFHHKDSQGSKNWFKRKYLNNFLLCIRMRNLFLNNGIILCKSTPVVDSQKFLSECFWWVYLKKLVESLNLIRHEAGHRVRAEWLTRRHQWEIYLAKCWNPFWTIQNLIIFLVPKKFPRPPLFFMIILLSFS